MAEEKICCFVCKGYAEHFEELYLGTDARTADSIFNAEDNVRMWSITLNAKGGYFYTYRDKCNGKQEIDTFGHIPKALTGLLKKIEAAE